MPVKQLNLIDAHFQNSNLFKHLPIFDAIHYMGHPEGNVQHYRAIREDQECKLLAVTVIRQEESILWEAAEDLLKRCTIDAATRMQGIFTFDLLTFDIHREVKTFNYLEFSTLISNSSRKIPPGEQRLVKYSSAYGILQKMVAESWGKITLKTAVEVYKDKPALFYLLVKRLFKLDLFPRNPLILLINDLSSEPIFDPQDQKQQESLAKIVEEQTKNSIEFLPEVYVQDKRGVRELMSGSLIKDSHDQ